MAEKRLYICGDLRGDHSDASRKEIETMRKLRIKNEGEGFYHVTSRCVDRAFKFDDEDKTRIVSQIHRMADFCGVEVSTFTVMSNHFHILLHVLPRGTLTDDELASRVAALYGRNRAEMLRTSWAAYRRTGNEASLRRLEEERGALLRRMGDLSNYMKELKQWISRDYNKEHARKGTLWEDRFWSCLLEDNSDTLTSVAAYIDLNAVRAGIVERPEDYRWCGYAEAHAGHGKARNGIGRLFSSRNGVDWIKAEERYGWLIRATSGTAASLRERNATLTRALAMGSMGFILATYARFPRVFAAKRRPTQPFVMLGKGTGDAVCASHRPHKAAIC